MKLRLNMRGPNKSYLEDCLLCIEVEEFNCGSISEMGYTFNIKSESKNKGTGLDKQNTSA